MCGHERPLWAGSDEHSCSFNDLRGQEKACVGLRGLFRPEALKALMEKMAFVVKRLKAVWAWKPVKKLTLYTVSYLVHLKQGVWSFQQNIKNEETKMISNTLPFAVKSGSENSTNNKFFQYFQGWRT